jgi:hypothetical protein
MVDWNTLSVELATKHFCANGHAEHIASELTMGMRVVNTSGSFENLDDGALAGNFEDLTLSCLAVSELDVHDLGEFGELDIVEDDEWTFDIEHSSVINTGCDIVVSLRGSGVYLSE